MPGEVGLFTEAVLAAVDKAKSIIADVEKENPEPIPFMMKKVSTQEAAEAFKAMPPEKIKEWMAVHATPVDPQGARAALTLLWNGQARTKGPRPTAEKPIPRGGY